MRQVATLKKITRPTLSVLSASFVAGFFSFLFLSAPLLAQSPFVDWQQVGPEGGHLFGLIVDPNDDSRWLALSGRGLYERSGDGEWRQTGSLPSGSGILLAMEAGQPQRLLATSTGSGAVTTTVVWRSEDGGATWEDLAIPTGSRVEVVALVSTSQGPGPPGYLAATDKGLWRWQPESGWTELLGDRFLDFDLAPDGSLAVALTVAADSTARQVRRSVDGGSTWEILGGLEPRTVESVAVEGSFFYAIGSEPNGDRFIASRLEGPGLWAIQEASGLPATSFFSSLEIIDIEGLDLFFSYRPPATYRSVDLGRTWTRISPEVDPGGGTTDLAVARQRYDFASVGTQLIAYGATGAWSSTNGGNSWQERNDGLFLHFIEAVAVDPELSEQLYVRSSSGESFRSEDGGGTWERLPLGPADGDLLILPGEPQRVFIGAENGWYRSADGGETWQLQQASETGREHRVESFALSPQNADRVLAAGTDDGLGGGVSRDAAYWWSEDGGGTWSRGVTNGSEGTDFFSATFDPFEPSRAFLVGSNGGFRVQDGSQITPLEGVGTFAWSIGADPFVAGRLLVRTPSELLRSLDGGDTWTSLDSDPPFDEFSVLRADPRVEDRFWAESGAGLWRSDDGGESWQLATENFPDLVNTFTFDPRFPRTVYAGVWRNSLMRLILADGLGCGHPQILCLGQERFVLESRWRDFEGREGVGQKADLTADTGYFWFFDPANVELVTKVLDGRGFNGNHWVFYGSLSNVEFGLKVTDTKSQQVVTYQNPSGQFASVGDIEAFPELLTLDLGPASSPWRPAKIEGCDDLENALCIGDRFRLSAVWRDFDNRTGTGTPQDLTEDTAYFTFFSPTNVELMVKVLDGRGFNGRWWVFFSSLSNVEFTLTVEDLETGAVKQYRNNLGNFASVGDTEAF